jgi:hypothetical protein
MTQTNARGKEGQKAEEMKITRAEDRNSQKKRRED